MSKPVTSERSASTRRNRAATQAAGLCVWCREPRGANGTKWNCRSCADRITSMALSRYHWHRDAGTCPACGIRFQRRHILLCQPCGERTKARRIARELAQSA
jgi:hypothetical protein